MTIARHTCLSLVTQKSFDMAQQFLRRLPHAWHNGANVANHIVSELVRVTNGLRCGKSTQEYKSAKSYIDAINNSSCWKQVEPWFLFQHNQLGRPLITALVSRSEALEEKSEELEEKSEELEEKSETSSTTKEKAFLDLDHKDERVSPSALRKYFFSKVKDSDKEGAWAKLLNDLMI